jgi:hypothetical protein
MTGSAKAVADGAAAWYIRRAVTARATRFAYGTDATESYDDSNLRHRGRIVHDSYNGKRVSGTWSEIVAKVGFHDNGAGIDHERRDRVALLHLMIYSVKVIISYTRHQTHF